ncbi:carboxypeptidase-like regulatory domain-containing protein [Paraflavitalea speifideaquila]|uniref:carboxypeptidase-like regulatory domain-containing protein n=1 Tax=Paraflavitalea speifideaquila TaxID=3076558 RepID=UPI0028EE89B8|nr:carboxypeptidase-like regulatory domain-containing protein [Paraflavitalea speifideiaquila]
MTTSLSKNCRPLKGIALLLVSQLIAVLTMAQVTISGKVTGSTDQPLTAISVTVKTTTYGTATDATGNFSLTAPSNPVM